jgi:hypothetical protein
MSGFLKTFQWTEKPKVSRDMVFAAIIAVAAVILVFKLAPYFESAQKTVVYTPKDSRATFPKEDMGRYTLLGPQQRSYGAGSAAPSPIQKSSNEKKGRSVVERPLFDGLSVLVRAVLLTPYSSLQSDTPIEAQIYEIQTDGSTSEIDIGPALHAKLVGVGTANLSVKKVQLRFQELVSSDGRSYAVTGMAVDPKTLAAGLEGDYSSGLGKRLLGLTLNRAMVLGDQIAVSKIIQGTADGNDLAALETQRAIMETNQQATTSLSSEVTKDLRETPSVIELPQGALLTIRLRASERGVP